MYGLSKNNKKFSTGSTECTVNSQDCAIRVDTARFSVPKNDNIEIRSRNALSESGKQFRGTTRSWSRNLRKGRGVSFRPASYDIYRARVRYLGGLYDSGSGDNHSVFRDILDRLVVLGILCHLKDPYRTARLSRVTGEIRAEARDHIHVIGCSIRPHKICRRFKTWIRHCLSRLQARAPRRSS